MKDNSLILGKYPEVSAPLGIAFEWLHAFALGEYPDWDDSLEGPGACLVRTARFACRRLFENLDTYRDDSGVWIFTGHTPHKRADAEEIIKAAEAALDSWRSLATHVVWQANKLPDAASLIADTANLGWATSSTSSSANDEYWRAYIRLGVSGYKARKIGGKAKRGASRVSAECKERLFKCLVEIRDGNSGTRPSFETGVQRARRRSGFPLSQSYARKLGKDRGLKW